MTFDELKEKAHRLPLEPGVYLMHDRSGEIIYIGKAKVLRNRVSQYFADLSSHTLKTRRMRQTVRRAAALKVGIGAHPGFPDLLGFGRREMKVTPQEAADYVTYQLGALAAFARAEGVELQHLKPHGALYNMPASWLPEAVPVTLSTSMSPVE